MANLIRHLRNNWVQSDTAPLKRVLLKHARDAFINQDKINHEANDLNYLAIPDFDRAEREYDAFVNLLERQGVTTEFLPLNDDTSLDSIYVRDNAVTTDAGIVLCNMGKSPRLPETEHQRQYYLNQGISIMPAMPSNASLEGGDVTWLNNNLLVVARGYRTNQSGIDYLQQHIKSAGFKKIQGKKPDTLTDGHGHDDVFHPNAVTEP